MFSNKRFIAFWSALVILFAGCACESIAKISPRDLRLLDEYVLALRLSPQLNRIAWGAHEGYVLLVRADGSADIVNVGYMDNGKLVWNRNGLFFGGPTTEYALEREGIKAHERGVHEEYEAERFSDLNEKGSIAVYNAGIAEDGDIFTIVSSNGDQLNYWDISGFFRSFAHCEDKILGITSSGEVNSEVKRLLSAPLSSDVLMQLYPKPESTQSSIAAQIDRSAGYEYHHFMGSAPCINGVIYILAFKTSTSNSQNTTPVLRVWDSISSAYKDIPLISEDGEPLAIDSEDIDLAAEAGSMNSDNSLYYWVSWRDGKVRAVNLSSGITRELFTVDISYARGQSQFFLTDNKVFVLDVKDDRQEMVFASYSIPSGTKKEYFTIRGLDYVERLRMPRNIIRDMAINPQWLTRIK